MNKYRLKWAELVLDEDGRVTAPLEVLEKCYSCYTIHAALEAWRDDMVRKIKTAGRHKKFFGNRVYSDWQENGRRFFSKAEALEVTCIGNEHDLLQELIRKELNHEKT